MSRRESESIYDLGSTSLAPHSFLSSCKHSWNATLAGSEIPMRPCTSVERRVKRDGLETHAIQVLDEPRQILALQVRKSVSILVPAKEVAELLVKLRRSFVKVAELS